MDKEKEGVLGAMAEAAKTSMYAAIEGVSSAATNMVEAVTGATQKPRRRTKRSTTKKAAAPGAATASRRGATRKSVSSRGRRSDLAQGELVQPLRPAGPHGPLRASALEGALKQSGPPRSPGLPKVVDAQRSAAHGRTPHYQTRQAGGGYDDSVLRTELLL
jgi:hypothetical protein